MDLRHEWKHEISDCDRLVLRQRLSAVMQLDPHAIDGKYFIRSLHFDNGTDKALREKLGAVGQKRVAQDYRYEQMLEQYRALYAETAQAHGLPDQTDSEELWLELGSN